MRKIKEYELTFNSYVFKKIHNFYNLGCDRCPPHRGCNRFWKSLDKNWKKYRKTQWK